jgi:hypothetical protein
VGGGGGVGSAYAGGGLGVGKIVRLCAYKPKGNRNKHTDLHLNKEIKKEKTKGNRNKTNLP